MRMVASASQRAIATNYGPEVYNEPESVPLYPQVPNHPEGPYWRGNHQKKPLPEQ